jgi:hypothetical protein
MGDFLRHNMSSPTGLRTLVDVGMSHVETVCPDILPGDYEQVHEALTGFVQGGLSYECCRQVLLSTIKRDNPLVDLPCAAPGKAIVLEIDTDSHRISLPPLKDTRLESNEPHEDSAGGRILMD